jgi:hypothetical protein
VIKIGGLISKYLEKISLFTLFARMDQIWFSDCSEIQGGESMKQWLSYNHTPLDYLGMCIDLAQIAKTLKNTGVRHGNISTDTIYVKGSLPMVCSFPEIKSYDNFTKDLEGLSKVASLVVDRIQNKSMIKAVPTERGFDEFGERALELFKRS